MSSTSIPQKTRTWILQHPPTTNIVISGANATFAIEERELPALQDGQILVQLLYLSNDPAQRTWMDANQDPERLYAPPVRQGDPVSAMTIQKVIASKDPEWTSGSLVRCFGSWSEHSVLPGSGVQAVQEVPGVSVTHQLGVLGFTGLTALVGLRKVGEAKEGETIVISGAAGATGSVAVQIAKHVIGCRKVIGLAGSEEKCRWVESLGADVCINYKTDWKTQLKKETEGFVDMYFDNVGGEQLDFMLTRLARYGRVIACGGIADYNRNEKTGVKNWMEIVMQRLSIRGFIVSDFVSEFPQLFAEVAEAAREGKIKAGEENETVVDTRFEDIPVTWTKLFSGGNRGKLVTKMV